MRKLVLFSIVLGLFVGGLFVRQAAGADPVIEMLLEKGIITEEDANKLYEEQAKQAPVLLKNAGSQLTLDGRIFVGYYDSERPGSDYEHGSFEIPDGKIRFTWKPKENIEVVNRLSVKFTGGKADVDGLDYFYLQLNGIIPNDRKSRLRLGKIKMDFGEETWTDNPAENTAGLVSNSASSAGGYDEGVELYGHFIPDRFGYAVSLTNGEDKDGKSGATDFGYAAKLFVKPIAPLLISASYYNADGIKKGSNSALKIGGLNSEPTGVTSDWSRQAWEIDCRYKDSKMPVSAAAAYGEFTDEPDNASDREGSYYYVEVRYDFTPKLFAGARYGVVELDNNATAKMNDITDCNKYSRTSLGVGYNLNKLVTLKAEYSWNDNDRPGDTSIDDNQFVVGVAAKF